MDTKTTADKPTLSRLQFLRLGKIGVGSALLAIFESTRPMHSVDAQPALLSAYPSPDKAHRPFSVPSLRPLLTDFADTIRSTGKADPTSGVGTEINYDAGTATGNILVIDRTANPDAYKALSLSGLNIKLNTNAVERMRIDSGGNVGIGTTTPAGKLDVAGGNIRTTNGYIDLQGAAGATGLLRSHPTIAGIELGSLSSSPIWFITNSTERMRIDEAGNVGIGTTSPTSKLYVVKTAKGSTIYAPNHGSDTTPGVSMIGVYGDADGTAGIKYGIYGLARNGGTNYGVNGYATGGAVNWGGWFFPDVNVSSVCYAASFQTTSDRRLKTKIAPLAGVLDKLAAINGLTYEWNETYAQIGVTDDEKRMRSSKLGKQEIGLIAQDVQSVFPEVVSTWRLSEDDLNGYLSVDYGRLVAVLISAVNELAARLAKVEASRKQVV